MYYEVLQHGFVNERASCTCDVRPGRRMYSDSEDSELQRLDRVVSSDSAASSAENHSTEGHTAEPPMQTLVG
jgi:arrestin-related trafficking adapter 3/6